MTDTTTAIHNDELSLLAACMNGYDPHSINLTPEDFDQPKHAAVWRAIHEVLDKGQTIDPQVVYDALGPTFQDDAVWVVGYLIFFQNCYFPRVWLFNARKDLQKSGFACAIESDNTPFILFIDHKVHMVKNRFNCIFIADIFQR